MEASALDCRKIAQFPTTAPTVTGKHRLKICPGCGPARVCVSGCFVSRLHRWGYWQKMNLNRRDEGVNGGEVQEKQVCDIFKHWRRQPKSSRGRYILTFRPFCLSLDNIRDIFSNFGDLPKEPWTYKGVYNSFYNFMHKNSGVPL